MIVLYGPKILGIGGYCGYFAVVPFLDFIMLHLVYLADILGYRSVYPATNCSIIRCRGDLNFMAFTWTNGLAAYLSVQHMLLGFATLPSFPITNLCWSNSMVFPAWIAISCWPNSWLVLAKSFLQYHGFTIQYPLKQHMFTTCSHAKRIGLQNCFRWFQLLVLALDFTIVFASFGGEDAECWNGRRSRRRQEGQNWELEPKCRKWSAGSISISQD